MTEITEVPSPFCGIGADDLTIQVNDLAVKVIENGCAVNTPAFEQAITDTSARVDGKEVSLDVAVAKAAELLGASNQPVIGGCATDVNGMRGVMALADRSGAVVDNMNFTAARRNFLALQDTGWMTTTLAEIKNRCDYFLVVGVDLEGFSPRFFERYLWNKESMFLTDTSQREVVYIGKAPSGDASTSPTGCKAKVLPCADEDLPEVMAVLRALVKGKKIVADNICGIAVSDLQVVADQLKAAKYGVVTWAAGALGFEQAELTVQMLTEMVKDINTMDTRCSGFPLGGKEGDQTANQVCGWTSAYPARTRFSSGFPEYDPFLYDSNVMLANGEADALVWVQAFNSASVPPKVAVPTIVVARSGMVFDTEPDVFIPVGTPGIDHAGHAYRLDNVVAIRLKKCRDSGLPSTADVLHAIEQAL
ncbi:formylmethanofuran dehydrogenase subunit B [Bathymodiolus platifrons methanotrophic gill symbiont]|uniref:formylmethanofuran dehydrogenase subunit B n=1 Tax=Bathymodiolus platifrons methanotrophic gill symbiont TaxID=113268 RepID=UPI000B41E94C|nr:formylmethanofuran dehydrogenase subunit B [Bathymodiolus platifrons methanotrophic gill symbiont]MCK5870749.1 formylmethanofuran dehydrogenase subunit B [Methyloprofundus sp.]TXK97962.1 formylmethanofuran dehydrogenase subunit B [Methylococcaceae bacterium CS4]TXL00278.1 formylmethanofuran dehydrogenase subunit B [Methylococcaceae bacterium CS5]TXL04861.1 formylmethanofuran dehydrogenase subunit B [Methylococcaceae bacterium CS1]TXL04879.1 formylmethanofuran dehydrogenase subunit B [Methyl